MKTKAWLAVIFAAAASQGFAMPTESDQTQIVGVRLNAAPINGGAIAHATLAAVDRSTGINLFVSGVPDWVSLPVHVYSYIYPGTCGQLASEPAYAMNQTVITEQIGGEHGAWNTSKSVPVALAQLRASEHSIVLRTSPADGNRDIFCGEIH